MQISFVNRMSCSACRCFSDKTERLFTMPLDLPDEPRTVEELIANQWGQQPLREGDDPYRCPKQPPCSSEANVTKSVMPKHWPKVLVLTLKRWSVYFQDGQLVTDKVPTMVHFETLLPVARGHAPYHLRGVIEHHGEAAGGGHYTSFMRAADHFWYYCNDGDSPQRVPTDIVLAAQAYVLVYEAS